MNYQRVYAYLVGTIDRALDLLEEGDLVKARPIRELLQNALLQAEEAYICASEKEPKTPSCCEEPFREDTVILCTEGDGAAGSERG